MTLYVYMDESGDLGFEFDSGSSQYFVITLVVTKDSAALARCMKKAREKVIKKKWHQVSELKANKSSENVINRVLAEFQKVDAQIHYIVVDKKQVFDYLRSQKKRLYNYIAGIILGETNLSFDDITMIVDKRETKLFARDNFDAYIVEKLQRAGRSAKISHFASSRNASLQTVDHLCWSIFRNYEHHDSRFYAKIQHKITTSKKLWRWE